MILKDCFEATSCFVLFHCPLYPLWCTWTFKQNNKLRFRNMYVCTVTASDFPSKSELRMLSASNKILTRTCKIRGYKTLYPIRVPLCFRPHKSGAVHGRANLFLFVGTQDRWIQFQIMSILGINGGTGIPVYRKKCGVRGRTGRGGAGEADGSYFGIMIPDASCERRVFHASFRVISDGCNHLGCIGTQYNMSNIYKTHVYLLRLQL